jgi:hypothetical protein
MRLINLAYKIKRDKRLREIKHRIETEQFELSNLIKKHEKSSTGLFKRLRPSFYNREEIEEDIRFKKEDLREIEKEYVQFYESRASHPIKMKAVALYNRLPVYAFFASCEVAGIIYVIISTINEPANFTNHLKNFGYLTFLSSLALIKPK